MRAEEDQQMSKTENYNWMKGEFGTAYEKGKIINKKTKMQWKK